MSIVFYQTKKNKQTLLTKISNLYTTGNLVIQTFWSITWKADLFVKKKWMKSAHIQQAKNKGKSGHPNMEAGFH